MKHHGVMTDQALRAMRLRNAARVQARIEQMGSRWLLHPDNASGPLIQPDRQACN